MMINYLALLVAITLVLACAPGTPEKNNEEKLENSDIDPETTIQEDIDPLSYIYSLPSNLTQPKSLITNNTLYDFGLKILGTIVDTTQFEEEIYLPLDFSRECTTGNFVLNFKGFSDSGPELIEGIHEKGNRTFTINYNNCVTSEYDEYLERDVIRDHSDGNVDVVISWTGLDLKGNYDQLSMDFKFIDFRKENTSFSGNYLTIADEFEENITFTISLINDDIDVILQSIEPTTIDIDSEIFINGKWVTLGSDESYLYSQITPNGIEVSFNGSQVTLFNW